MRSFAILATIYAAIIGTTSALVDASDNTRVTVKANWYDPRTRPSGCSPDGCVPDNTRDGDIWDNSRWSCQGKKLDSSDQDDGCCITYYFKRPQDIVEVEIVFHKGDERTRTLDVFNNDDYHDTIKSDGQTDGFETFYLNTDETSRLKFCVYRPASNKNVWLSITEVRPGRLLAMSFCDSA